MAYEPKGRSPLYLNEEFAKTTPFGGRVAHGILTLFITGQVIFADGGMSVGI